METPMECPTCGAALSWWSRQEEGDRDDVSNIKIVETVECAEYRCGAMMRWTPDGGLDYRRTNQCNKFAEKVVKL